MTMTTDGLIEMLARGAGPAPRHRVPTRVGAALLGGLAASAVLALIAIGPLPLAVFATPAPWMKLAYTGALAMAAGLLAAQFARPVPRSRGAAGAMLAVLAVMTALAAASLIATPAEERASALLGQTWWSCPWTLCALSVPALGAVFLAVRGLAPTRLRAAGFACGLAAGAVGAIGYSLACPESSAAFVAVWYTLGIGLTGLLGALLGPRLLRW